MEPLLIVTAAVEVLVMFKVVGAVKFPLVKVRLLVVKAVVDPPTVRPAALLSMGSI